MAGTIRDHLDHFIGRTVIDITSHDPGCDDPDDAYIMLMFDDGSYIRYLIGADGELPWGTTNNCLDHVGCISAEDPVPDPALLVR